jgi:3-oxoacyl-[acyl-carrier protein] reductase
LIDLAGTRVLVTGGSRGIGAACARAFARVGAAVAVHYREREEAAAAVLDELARLAPGEPHVALRAEVSDPAAVRTMFAELAARWGGLDCLVNNAGVWVHNPLADLDVEAMEATWRINLSGCFLCAQAALPLLCASRDGNIVNISSTAGQRGEAFYSPYAASKGGLISATKAWSSELAPKIRVNCVAPGWVDTEMSAGTLRGPQRAAIEASVPLGRVATAEDIAGPVVFLASALARQITGEVLNVNGGSVLAG